MGGGGTCVYSQYTDVVLQRTTRAFRVCIMPLSVVHSAMSLCKPVSLIRGAAGAALHGPHGSLVSPPHLAFCSQAMDDSGTSRVIITRSRSLSQPTDEESEMIPGYISHPPKASHFSSVFPRPLFFVTYRDRTSQKTPIGKKNDGH
jgi:hypothetical protein